MIVDSAKDDGFGRFHHYVMSPHSAVFLVRVRSNRENHFHERHVSFHSTQSAKKGGGGGFFSSHG